MEDVVFSTPEAARPERWARYSLWFKSGDGQKLEVRMTLDDLLRLNGLTARAIEYAQRVDPSDSINLSERAFHPADIAAAIDPDLEPLWPDGVPEN